MSYIASLNLLNTDSPAPPSEDAFSDDLSLWANAQFTFDSTPGSALLDDDKKEENEKLFASLTDFTIENQQQQQQQQQEQQSQLPRQQDDPSNYLSSDYLLSQLQQLAPSSTDSTPTHVGLPRLAPAPTEQQHQLHHHQQQQNERYLNALTMPNPYEKNGNNNNKRRSMNDDNGQDLSRSTAAAASAAEDDKRRRNTAASARFRQKKKLREQALEQTAKEMSAKCDALDKRVRELELEAKWLRALVVEKNPSLLADKAVASTTTTAAESSDTITTTTDGDATKS